MRLCSNVPAQFAVKEALQNKEYTQQYLKPGGRIYEQREEIYTALNKIDGIREDLSTVELVTANNYKDIAKLKAVK